MSVPSPHLPRYRRHKSKFACVKLSGQWFHLGEFGSPGSIEKYNRLIAEWMARGRTALTTKKVITVRHVLGRFIEHLHSLYESKSGRDTGTRSTYRPVLQLLDDLYGSTPAEQFGPLALKAIRVEMVRRGNGRKYINEGAAKIIAAFCFAASEQLISKEVYLNLQSVPNLKRFERVAAGLFAGEPRKIGPVSDQVFEATIARCSPPVAAMARVQRLAGMRPGEATQMRPMDIDRAGRSGFTRPASIRPSIMGSSPWLRASVRVPHLSCV